MNLAILLFYTLKVLIIACCEISKSETINLMQNIDLTKKAVVSGISKSEAINLMQNIDLSEKSRTSNIKICYHMLKWIKTF